MKDHQIKTDDKLINHIRNIKLLQALYSGKKFYVECFPTDTGSIAFPNSNLSVKEIELPNFDLYEEKLGYKWIKESQYPNQPTDDRLKKAVEFCDKETEENNAENEDRLDYHSGYHFGLTAIKRFLQQLQP